MPATKDKPASAIDWPGLQEVYKQLLRAIFDARTHARDCRRETCAECKHLAEHLVRKNDVYGAALRQVIR